MSDDHKIKMQETQKKMRDAQKEKIHKRGVVIVITGNGKGKSTSGFGTVLRAMGHGFNVAVIQFIKGKWKTGESKFFAEHQGESVYYHAMETGFTWNTQDREGDIAHAKDTWAHAEKCLKDDTMKVVMIDELTYMINYGYLDKDVIVSAIKARPEDQTVIITGRDACDTLKDVSDTFSEVLEVKHAYQIGIRAQKGVDF